MVIERYKFMIKNLLPQGLAWPRQKDTNMDSFLMTMAVEPARVDGRVVDMLIESYPLTTTELITDWERVTGLPEECEGLAETLQRRREAVHQKLSSLGGQSPQYYIDVAEELGYTISITEFTPFRAGQNSAGDPVNDEDWAYTYQINGLQESIKLFAAGEGTAGEPLASWGNDLLECVLTRIKPAHTIILFTYGLFEDQLFMINNTFLGIEDFRRATYRLDLATEIKNGAGVPTGLEPGIQTGVTPGLTDEMALSAQSQIAGTSESAFSAVAAEGDGTKGDPYIIRDKEFDGGGTDNWSLYLDMEDTNFYVEFENCRFYDCVTANIQLVEWDLPITFRNCDFYNTVSNGELFLHGAADGKIRLIDCTFSGCDSFAGYLISAGATGSLEIRNLLITDDNGSWRAGCDIFLSFEANVFFDVEHVETDPGITDTGQDSVFQIAGCAPGSYFRYLKTSGKFNHFFADDIFTPAAQKEINIEFFDFAETKQEAIHLRALLKSNIRFGEVVNNTAGAGYRQIFLNGSDVDIDHAIVKVDVDNVKFTKQSGTLSAGNECLESLRGKEVRFRNCYVTECPEDAFEHVIVIENCTIERCVGENVAGQVVDFYKQWDEDSWGIVDEAFGSENAIDSKCYTAYIYGDCGDWGVIFSGLNGVYFHDIYTDTTASSPPRAAVRIEDRDNIVVRNVYGCGPIPLQDAVGNGTTTPLILINGGEDIRIHYIDNEDGIGNPVIVTA